MTTHEGNWTTPELSFEETDSGGLRMSLSMERTTAGPLTDEDRFIIRNGPEQLQHLINRVVMSTLGVRENDAR